MALALAALTAMLPPAAVAAEQETGTNFRQRISSNEDLAASDVQEEVRFGREVAARVLARFGYYDNPRLEKYVNLVGKTLAQSTNRPELDFHFAILNTDEINGYAAPGGYVFITRGALAHMHDESELAGALAHEIGHVVERQAVKELGIKGKDESTVSGLAMLIGGSSESARAAFSQAVDKALDLLFKDGYKRADEVQADQDAVMFCALSGYSPEGLVHYFERIKGIVGKQTAIIDRTHPPFADRIAWLQKEIHNEGIDPAEYNTYRSRFAAEVRGLK